MHGFLPLVQRCTSANKKGTKQEFILNHYMPEIGTLRSKKYQKTLSMTDEAKSFCFINAVATRNEYAGIVMTKEEYYDGYIRRHIKYDRTINAVKINYLRRSHKLLMKQPYGFVLKRFELFEEAIMRAMEDVSVCNLKMMQHNKNNYFLGKWYLHAISK